MQKCNEMKNANTFGVPKESDILGCSLTASNSEAQ
jgi:hypothetical protein